MPSSMGERTGRVSRTKDLPVFVFSLLLPVIMLIGRSRLASAVGFLELGTSRVVGQQDKLGEGELSAGDA